MKKLKLFAMLIFAITIVTFCFGTKCLAMQNNNEGIVTTSLEGEPVNTSETENNTVSKEIQARGENTSNNQNIHNGDLYIVGSQAQYVMDKIVNGNLFFFGNSIKITGQINGSIFVFASNVEIAEETYIACHTFIFANTVQFSGSTYDAYIACSDLKMGTNAAVYRDLKAFSDYSYLAGTIGRDVILSGENIECIETENGLNIRGNITYEAREEIKNLDKASIVGETKFTPMREKENENVVWDYVWSLAGAIVFNVILYMILMFIAPEFIKKSKEYASTKSLLAFGIGVAFVILLPIIAILLLLTMVGVRIIILNSVYLWSSINVKYINCRGYIKRIFIRKIKNNRRQTKENSINCPSNNSTLGTKSNTSCWKLDFNSYFLLWSRKYNSLSI